MLYCKELDQLSEDDFEGSNEEHQIFMDVFYGRSVVGGASKRCSITEPTHSEAEGFRPAKALPYSNSDNSVVTTQSSTSLMEDSCNNVLGDSGCFVTRNIAGFGCGPQNYNVCVARDDHDTSAKRMKRSDGELSAPGNGYSNGDLLIAEKAPVQLNSSKEIVLRVQSIDLFNNYPTKTCPLVESSSQGFVCSTDLHTRLEEVSRRRGHAFHGNASKSKCGKQATESKIITSPVSQHSIIPECLVGDISVAHTSIPLLPVIEKSPESAPFTSDAITTTLSNKSLKDLYSRLRGHVNYLLKAAGWAVEKKQIGNKPYADTIYKSPTGKIFTAFYKIWNLFGKSLFADYKMIRQENGKQWMNIKEFSSNLQETLIHFEKEDCSQMEASYALVHQWSLLDPFVTVVMVNRQIGNLRKGIPVKAATTVVSDLKERKEIESGKEFAGVKDLVKQSNGSVSVHNKSGSTKVSSDNPHLQTEQNSQRNLPVVGKKRKKQAAKALKGVSIYLKEQQNECMVTDTMGLISSDQIKGSNQSCVPTQRSDISGSQIDNFLYDVPIATVDSVGKGTQIVPPQQESRLSFSSFVKQTTRRIEANTVKGVSPEVVNVDVIEFLMPRSTSSDLLVNDLARGSTALELEQSNPEDVKETRGKYMSENNQFREQVESIPLDLNLSMGNEVGSGKALEFFTTAEAIPVENARKNFEQSEHLDDESCSGSEASNFKMEPTSGTTGTRLTKKRRKKCKSLSEIKVTRLSSKRQKEVEMLNCEKQKHKSSSSIRVSQHQSAKGSKLSKPKDKHISSGASVPSDAKDRHKTNSSRHTNGALVHTGYGSKTSSSSKIIKCGRSEVEKKIGGKRSRGCQMDDDDLLLASIIINKDLSSNRKQFARKRRNFSALRKLKHKGGSCKLLLRSPGRGGKHFTEGKWSSSGARTVLCWLIDSGVISVNDVVHYLSPKGDTVIKDGWVTKDGILCKCCDTVLSVIDFKVHAGFKSYKPCLNLFLESGKSFTLCQLEAWSAEYKARKDGQRAAEGDERDQNDDTCGHCGDGGVLICCDNCPSTFHQTCLSAQEFPEGSWYCSNCTCHICGDLVIEVEASTSPGALKCSQCDRKYHRTCTKESGTYKEVSDTWFCGANCQQIFTGLRSRIGNLNHIDGGYSWTLLRCIQGDQKVPSAQKFALMAECNPRLAVALTIMEECFVPMIDPRTGVDMIPQVMYNWGSEFSRLNYQGFYTLVLEKADEVISVASVRVHGVTIAEMPLIATCSNHRRQGMCRRLLNAIEELLISFKVERLVITAIPSLVDTWTKGFGFIPMEDEEKKQLSNINFMIFPGTILLRKSLYEKEADEIKYSGSLRQAGLDGESLRSFCVGDGETRVVGPKLEQLEKQGSKAESKHLPSLPEVSLPSFVEKELEIISTVRKCSSSRGKKLRKI
ncbi:hypothetical protein MKW94_003208 [Papaver nudicaule]|uniref:Uncharacterized protein n=1 Tax=Papaver nudicaule TaxID=74823 RepID=A0AA41V8K8_PAPNU|nr:hypothetical protein [Papaver nudicaule]